MANTDREKLVEAFDHLVANVGKTIRETEEILAPTLDEIVHNAQVLTREIFALTQEEAESLGTSLRRDMHKANQTLNQQRKEISDWLSFDMQLVEDHFIDMIARAADKTWLDFRQFEQQDERASLYRAGEVCNAGTLSCNRCSHRLELSRSGQIPTCPNCGHDEFFRVIG